MNAFAQKVRRLADGTVKAFIRLEDDCFTKPVLAAISIFKGDIILTEKVEEMDDTVKLSALQGTTTDDLLGSPELVPTTILNVPSRWERSAAFNKLIFN